MKVTIDLTEHNARWLRSMASLGRMCDQITRALEKAAEIEEGVDDDLAQDLLYARKALIEAKPVLMNIEQCRQQLIDAGVKRLWKSGTEDLEIKE